MEFLFADNVYFSYDDTEEDGGTLQTVLNGVSLKINKGEYVAIIGHNGSGKSTLAKLFNLILDPTEGKIYYLGKDFSCEELTDDDVYELRRNVGMVFQNPDNQIVATVVEEDVAFGPENLGVPTEEIHERVRAALETVGMTEYAKKEPASLSGGQKQRVAIAGIIAMQPEVIIFDESTAMLDPLGRREVIAIMERLNREQGITVINITHYMEEAASADRVVVVNDGRIAMDGTPREVFSRVDELHSMGLEAPAGIELLSELAACGVAVDGAALTEAECVDSLVAYLDGRCGV